MAKLIPMRQDEEFCKSRFEVYLNEVDPAAVIIWTDGTRNEPPDFYLNVDGKEFAVEVTTLPEPVELGSQVLPRQSIDAARTQFVEHVEQLAIAEGILSGCYYVLFPAIQLAADFPKRRKQLEVKLLDYIRRTQVDIAKPAETIEDDDKLYCTVVKTSRPKTQLIVGSFPITLEWEGVAQQKACKLLQARIADKTDKLAHIHQPKILLLLNQYHFVDDDYYKQCVSSGLSGFEFFHTVFIVGSQQCYVLHSTNSNWME